jgi:hypothetical protein
VSVLSINDYVLQKVEQLEKRATAWKEDPTGDPAVVEPLANGVIMLAFIARQYITLTDHHAGPCQCTECQHVEWLGGALDDVLNPNYVHPCPPCPDCGHLHRLSACALCECKNDGWR